MSETFATDQLIHFCQQRSIPGEDFLAAYLQTYQPLIQQILKFNSAKQTHLPLVIGINAPQGAGKSTLGDLIQQVIAYENRLNVVNLSIDDFYYTRAERQAKAALVHPLFMTRGVPGTHDIPLAIDIFEKLLNLSPGEQIQAPRFDKATDDRASVSNWTRVTGPVDIILFEGWCVGSRPQNIDALEPPLNRLERDKDPDAKWRTHVNIELGGNYQRLFSLIDKLIYMNAPSFDCVGHWRKEQEMKLAQTRSPAKSKDKIMSSENLAQFMMYFERITRFNTVTLPKYADMIITLDSHRFPRSFTLNR